MGAATLGQQPDASELAKPLSLTGLQGVIDINAQTTGVLAYPRISIASILPYIVQWLTIPQRMLYRAASLLVSGNTLRDWFTDFAVAPLGTTALSNLTIYLFGKTTTTGSGTTNAVSASQGGILTLSSGGTAGSTAIWQSPLFMQTPNGGASYCMWRAKMNQFVNYLTDPFYLGGCGVTDNASNVWAGFVVNTAVNGNFQAFYDGTAGWTGFNGTLIDTGILHDNTAFHTFEVWYTGGTVYFAIDGVQVASHVYASPPGTAGLSGYVQNGATASTRSTQYDYAGMVASGIPGGSFQSTQTGGY